jgi:hypothetical protein
MGNLMQTTQAFVKAKYKTIEDCVKVVNITTLEGLTDVQLSYVIDFFHEEVDNSNPFSEFLEMGWNMLKTLDSYESRVKLVLEVIDASLKHFGIEKLDYEFYIKLISHLAYREIKGGK